METKFIVEGVTEYQCKTDSIMEVWGEDVSDGYHTMHELYKHRMALNIALFKLLALDNLEYVIRSKFHNDGTMFEGYFIVMALTEQGQISYHYKLEHWNEFNFLTEIDKCPPYDGHTSKDVIERLIKL